MILLLKLIPIQINFIPFYPLNKQVEDQLGRYLISATILVPIALVTLLTSFWKIYWTHLKSPLNLGRYNLRVLAAKFILLS